MKNATVPLRPVLVPADPRRRPLYVPSLMLKSAERVALCSLQDGGTNLVYPLLTVLRVPKATSRLDERTGERKIKLAPTLDEHLTKQCEILEGILQPSLLKHGVDRAMIDVEHLDRQLGQSTLTELDRRLTVGGIKRDLIPVVSVDQIAPHALATRRWLKNYKTGLALRVRYRAPSRGCPEGGWPETAAALEAMTSCGGRIDETDLVLDVGYLRAGTVDQRFEDLMAIVPAFLKMGAWRTVTVLAGAFPRSIGELDFDVYHELVRWDLILWKRLRRGLGQRGLPSPAFGDYAMVFPIPADGGTLPQANLRYTDERFWRVYRRETEPAMATICNVVSKERWFRGAEFSRGDEWIEKVAQDSENPGNAEIWIRTGLQHHLAFVLRQLRGLT